MQQCAANLNVFNCDDLMEKDNNMKQTDSAVDHYDPTIRKFGKMRRNKKSRYKNDSRDNKVRHFASALCDVIVETNGQSLFNCPVCRDTLYVPVTVDCGHTYCANCLNKLNNKCCECDSEITTQNSTNVLLQDVVTKWRELRIDLKEQFGKFVIVVCNQ